jgi:hypothetical protein
MITIEEETVTARRSALQRYQDRLKDAPGDPTLGEVTLFNWLRS